MGMKTNGRTMIEARKRGWLVWRVERRLPKTFTTVDLFNCFDSVALPGDSEGPLGIQSCGGGGDAARHLRKLTEDPDVVKMHRAWLAEGGRSQLWSWRKLKFRKKDGSWSKDGRWKLKAYAFEMAPGGVFYEEIAS